jgi:hypothetical protein
VLTIGEDSKSMGKRIASFFRSDLGVLVLVAAARMVLHIATDGQYGFHRDELQTLDDARHLDWGFVAYPPITPLIGRLELILFGTSLLGFRVYFPKPSKINRLQTKKDSIPIAVRPGPAISPHPPQPPAATFNAEHF